MIKFGELRDQKLVSQIVADLRKEGILVSTQMNDEGMIDMMIVREEDLPQALDRYRVALGLAPPPPSPPSEWLKMRVVPMGALTLFLLLTCIGLFCIKFFMGTEKLTHLFMLGSPNEPRAFDLILRGEYWRLITPIFLHFGFLHIIFNCLWLKEIGKVVEFEWGLAKYAVFILLSGVASNLGQYLVKGPSFGGMSGVIFAYLGYLWSNQKLNPHSVFKLPKTDILWMVGWLLLCMTNLLGPIANMAHALGLSMGILFGFVKNVTRLNLTNRWVFIFLGLFIFFPLLSAAIDYWHQNGQFYIHKFLA